MFFTQYKNFFVYALVASAFSASIAHSSEFLDTVQKGGSSFSSLFQKTFDKTADLGKSLSSQTEKINSSLKSVHELASVATHAKDVVEDVKGAFVKSASRVTSENRWPQHAVDHSENLHRDAQYREPQYREPQYREPQYREPQYREPQYREMIHREVPQSHDTGHTSAAPQQAPSGHDTGHTPYHAASEHLPQAGTAIPGVQSGKKTGKNTRRAQSRPRSTQRNKKR